MTQLVRADGTTQESRSLRQLRQHPRVKIRRLHGRATVSSAAQADPLHVISPAVSVASDETSAALAGSPATLTSSYAPTRKRPIAQLQAAFSPAMPLESMPPSEQNLCLVKVCKLIKAALG